MPSAEDKEMKEAVDKEIAAETAETMTIRHTAAGAAQWTIILRKAGAFSNNSTAEAEALIKEAQGSTLLSLQNA